jgi:tRNA(Ile)-lysidine synthetase-like protein
MSSGPWVVGVSGGCDSTALLRLICLHAPGLAPVVVHVNHQLRGRESDGDAAFVVDLCSTLGVECHVERLLERADKPSKFSSASLRGLRQRIFAEHVARRRAAGVLLAHHADDQAETVLLRLLRGGEPIGLAGIAASTSIAGVRYERPLLSIRRESLESFLVGLGQAWREDASNMSMKSARNRVRAFLHGRPDLIDPLNKIATTAFALRRWLREHTPDLPNPFHTSDLADLPALLARSAVRRRLRSHVDADAILPELVGRLIDMATDAASPARFTLPGGVEARRKKGQVWLG